MIKALVTTPKGPLVILGLSGENMTRLMADEPILVNLEDLGLLPIQIAIVGGRTEGEIMSSLGEHFDLGSKT